MLKELISVEEMLTLKDLTIPNYQRPYKWGEKSIRHLVNDIKESMDMGKNEYRIGTIILHKDEKDIYNIVDGQQRLISLTILLYALGEKNSCLLRQKCEFSIVSQKHITENYKTINTLKKNNKNDINTQEFANYILEKCKLVKIVTDSEQEAFQLFDSQNSRGKPLYPHDLLKAYHLREISVIDDATKNIINEWERINKKKLAELFEYYLYPIKQWIKLKDGLGNARKRGKYNFDSKKIDIFKGIAVKNRYTFTKYHRRNQGNYDIEYNDIFQLDQEIVAGKSFFHFVQHYINLLNNVRKIINDSTEIIHGVKNDNYVKKLYESALLFYIDRFDTPTNYVIVNFFKWVYYLRIKEYLRIDQLSINKYAKEERMFQRISDAVNPEDIFSMELPRLEENHGGKENYYELYKYLNGEVVTN